MRAGVVLPCKQDTGTFCLYGLVVQMSSRSENLAVPALNIFLFFLLM